MSESGWRSEGAEWARVIANRNFLIHQYDEIDREITWDTLPASLSTWKESPAPLIDEANAFIYAENAAAEAAAKAAE